MRWARPEYLGPSPRVRGVADQRQSIRAQVGPSLQVRGVVALGAVALVADGTIPAGAGSRSAGVIPRCPARDHPRGCRGGSRSACPSAWPGRDHPRVAGSSSTPAAAKVSCRGHPCACREQAGVKVVPNVYWGPTPRVRGAGVPRRLRHQVGGTIPAGAGKGLLDLQVYGLRGMLSIRFKGSGKQDIRPATAGRAVMVREAVQRRSRALPDADHGQDDTEGMGSGDATAWEVLRIVPPSRRPSGLS